MDSNTTEYGADERVENFNSREGDYKYGPCDKCKGRGEIARLRDGEFTVGQCECAIRYWSIVRAKQAGMGGVYDIFTMENYLAPRDWQRHLKLKAEEYIDGRTGWFFLCGQSGSGKSHLTCAIAREMLEAGKKVRYMRWRQDAPQLKALVNERDEYDRRMKDLTGADVLVIDDLFKGKVTEADINLAFEIIDARYNRPKCMTVISSERDMPDILDIDEAVGGRIAERARGFTLKTGNENLRLSNG